MILVTGGTGFLGSVLIKNLIDAGHSVIAVKRAHSIIPDALKASSLIQWVDADITDYFALKEIFLDIKSVYHCAALISNQSGDAMQIAQVNVEGTAHIVNLCLEHQARLVHVSSIAALGPNKNGQPLNEEAKWEMTRKTSLYSRAKHDAEMEVWRGIVEGLDAVIVNPSIIMGVGLGKGKVAANALFDQVKKGLKIYPLGSVGIVDVEDVASLMIWLMNSDISGERFILNSENVSSRDLLTDISVLMGRPAPTIQASKTLLSIAWRLAKVKATLFGQPAALTKYAARAASEKLSYDNSKITGLTAHAFKPVSETLKNVYQAYYAQ
ncbi:MULTISPECIES: NAD-dependent epimerase/dehydratase family protein [Sphingobacterium]|uniref:NAD-dependent epimerase/dehydratase family protein n=1 Tax=Sphingobacterium populi TaxID=1812824 RepID=A0ABW5UBC6_9SPHI|nr:NAD-dependent epimerase/dehydratase family protein [Sphingobacterium sp. CFCC 11742]